jgi:hypothetical protein
MKEEVIQILGSKLFLICILFFIISCDEDVKSSNKIVKENVVSKKDINKYQSDKNIYIDSCQKYDTSINNIFYFNNSASTVRLFKDVNVAWEKNDRAYFLNKDSTIYISLGVNYGGFKDEYKNIEISYYNPNSIPSEVQDFFKYNNFKNDFYFTKIETKDFITTNGIKLGISKDSLIHKLNFLKFNQKRDKKYEILEFYNEYCNYEANFYFKEGVLIKMFFGYSE